MVMIMDVVYPECSMWCSCGPYSLYLNNIAPFMPFADSGDVIRVCGLTKVLFWPE